MVKLGTYAAASAVGAVAVVFHAFQSRGQFYPAMLYLATSKISLVLLLNMALVLMCAVWQVVKVVFLGSLREAEIERLNEQSWRELMEVLFAMTIFRDEFNVPFVAMVTVLMFIKAFHWLAQKRLEYIETTPSVSRLSHFRIISFMAMLLLVDSLFLHNSVSFLLRNKRPSVSLFFAFEYVILATSTIATFLKYVFYACDMLMEGQWENKAVFTFYLELVRDLLHLSLYLFFFFVIFVNYGLPLHLVRELYETFRNFKARVADFIRYRKITSNMNDRFPDATGEELGQGDATCIICREEMVAAKKLPCGHLFHVHCLRSWLERQQTCPTCRSPVIAPEGGAAVPNVDRAAPAAQAQQQQQQELEGQGVATEGERTTEQVLGQSFGTDAGNIYAHHQERLKAAMAAASQYSTSMVYPVFNNGALYPANWCPAYACLAPQYLAPMMVPDINARNGVNQQSQGLRGPNNGSITEGLDILQRQSVGPSPQMAGYSDQLQSSPLYLWPISNESCHIAYRGHHGWARPHLEKNSQDLGSDVGRIVMMPAILQRQQMELQQEIEILQQQLQRITELRNQLCSMQQESAIVSSEKESNSRTPLVDLDTKGKGLACKDTDLKLKSLESEAEASTSKDQLPSIS
eukprot:c26828_g1_i1 orf=515-2416(-)